VRATLPVSSLRFSLSRTASSEVNDPSTVVSSRETGPIFSGTSRTDDTPLSNLPLLPALELAGSQKIFDHPLDTRQRRAVQSPIGSFLDQSPFASLISFLIWTVLLDAAPPRTHPPADPREAGRRSPPATSESEVIQSTAAAQWSHDALPRPARPVLIRLFPCSLIH